MPTTVAYNATTKTRHLDAHHPAGQLDDVRVDDRRRHRRREGSGRQRLGRERLFVVHDDPGRGTSTEPVECCGHADDARQRRRASIELGVKFTASTDGFITGIEFYKSTDNTGMHTGSLWSSTGQLLATGTFTSETASGWQTLVFDTPVAVSAGVTYVASYHTNVAITRTRTRTSPRPIPADLLDRAHQWWRLRLRQQRVAFAELRCRRTTGSSRSSRRWAASAFASSFAL